MTPDVAAREATTRRAWIAWVIVCVVWGTTYLAIKIGLETIPPFLLGGLRYVVAGVVLAAGLAMRGRPLPRPGEWRRLAILGFFLLGLGNGGVVWGEQFLSSGLTAVLIGTTPFWMVSVDAIVPGGGRLDARQWMGLSVGFAGIVALVWPDIARGGAQGRAFALGVLAIQIACAGWAVGSTYTRRHVMPQDVMGAAALQMIFGGVWLLLAATVTREWDDLYFTPRTWVAIIYLTIAGSIVAFAAYSYALRHLDVAVVSLYTYINPVIAVALGILALGEPFGWRLVVAVGIIAAGVALAGTQAPGPRPRASGSEGQGSGPKAPG